MHLRLRRASVLSLLALLALTLGAAVRAATPPASADAPLLALLAQFTAPDVPAQGPAEVPTERNWPEPAHLPATPGRGLAQHSMLYAGEGHNVLFLVHDGQVRWKYQAGRGGEIDDLWLLSNGHILYTRQHAIEEITPRKQVVWRFPAPAGTEIHSAQPLGLDEVAFVQNGLPPQVIVLHKPTGAVRQSFPLPPGDTSDPKVVHAQFRRLRVTAAGTFLLSFLKLGRVVEYDRTGRELWSYPIATPWSAIRLRNGHTLIVNERERLVREVNPAQQTVWEFRQSDLPSGLRLGNWQTAERLANGHTVIFANVLGVKPPDRPSLAQAIEVTPTKEVVWVLQDWKNLGPASTAQFLDQPGRPEHPGEAGR